MHALSSPTPPNKQTAREASISTSPPQARTAMSPPSHKICYILKWPLYPPIKTPKNRVKGPFCHIIKYIETHTHSLSIFIYFFPLSLSKNHFLSLEFGTSATDRRRRRRRNTSLRYIKYKLQLCRTDSRVRVFL